METRIIPVPGSEDKKTGNWKYWYPNGTLQQSSWYKDGSLNGPYSTYSEEGIPQEEGNYLEEKPDGKWIYFFPEGGKMREVTYENGKLEGQSLLYHRSGGEVKLREDFKNNKRDGHSIEYSPHGNVIRDVLYENGHKVRVVEDNTRGH